MTQTPSRDWQKDMEMAHTARYEYDISHLNNVLDSLFYWLGAYGGLESAHEKLIDEAGEYLSRADAAEVRINKLERELNSKKQLLRETDQSRTEVREMYRSVCDAAQEYKDNLELAEAREQRMKEELEGALRFIGRTEHIPEETVAGFIRAHFSQALSTLYPDTPAPTNEEV